MIFDFLGQKSKEIQVVTNFLHLQNNIYQGFQRTFIYFYRTLMVLDLISENNKLFPASKKKSIYKAVISKQTSVIYSISKNEITLLYFIDNRSDHQYY
jgi:hypothetical protein